MNRDAAFDGPLVIEVQDDDGHNGLVVMAPELLPRVVLGLMIVASVLLTLVEIIGPGSGE